VPANARWFLILAAAVAAGCGGSKDVTIESNSVALLRGHDVVADVPVQGAAARLTYGDGAFWAAIPDRGAVYRIDEGSHDSQRIQLGVRPFDAAVGEGALWVPDHDTSSLFRVDLESRKVTDAINLGEGGVEAGVGFSSIWVIVTSGRLLRIDPETLKVTGTVPNAATTAEGMEPKLAFAPDAVWVASPSSQTLARIDPRTLHLSTRNVGRATGAAYSDHALWVTDGVRYVWRLAEPRNRRVSAGTYPEDVDANSGGAWAVSYDDHAVHQIEADGKRRVWSMRLPRVPTAVATGEDLVAVAVGGPPL
jgi:DNA-binding beta-propeller fold protein YncE